MSLARDASIPTFHEYVTQYLLIPTEVIDLNSTFNGVLIPGQSLPWVEIPRFQRGISWELDNVKELIRSSSRLLGNAILAQQNRTEGQFEYLPANVQNSLMLVDGLQRFAVGTILLSVLHDLVISETPTRGLEANKFMALSIRVRPFSKCYLYNDKQFLNHSRKAIQDQYRRLKKIVEDYINEVFQTGDVDSFANEIIDLFISRQVAIDKYFNFDRMEVLSTFIGINTVRVDLGPVDLLRAHVIEKATIANWTNEQIENIENHFTDVLTVDQKPKQMFLPFVNAILRLLREDQFLGEKIFPSWNTSLLVKDVENLLDFIDNLENPEYFSPYLRELFKCGALPISILLAFFYTNYLRNDLKPRFFISDTISNEDEKSLYLYLIVTYRLLLNGNVGKTAESVDLLLKGSLPDNIRSNLTAFSNQISDKYFGKRLEESLDEDTLKVQLEKIDHKNAQRIFNAMMLPNKKVNGDSEDSETNIELSEDFNPLPFSKKSLDYNIDHLIPVSILNKNHAGGVEGNSLRNLAPLPANQNRIAKATNCSDKLKPSGIYEKYISSTTHIIKHEYSKWLVENYNSSLDAEYDDQSFLEKNKVIGDSRLSKMAEILLRKL